MTVIGNIESLFLARKFNDVIAIANQIEGPLLLKSPDTLAIIAMSQYLSGTSGLKNLSIARSRGSLEAQIWQAVIDYFQVSGSKKVDVAAFFYQYNYEKLRRSVHKDYPTEIHIETQTICNAACTFCPYPDLDRKGDKMDDELIDKIIDDLKEIPAHVKYSISPFKVSDPFLDKRIFKIISKINDELPNANIRLFTNGSALTDKNLEATRNIKNLANLWISLNEVDEDRYYALMGLNLNKVLDNLDNLHAKVSNGYPHQVVLSRVSNQTDYDSDFVKFTKDRYPLFNSLLTKRSDWVGKVKEDNLDEVPNLGCLRWFEISIMSNGQVSLCCMDGHGDHCIGDVKSQSVMEVYNSKEYKKMRRMANSRLAAASPCDTCNL